MTLAWMAWIAVMSSQDRPMLFEGQMRLAFVREGLLAAGIASARVILVDCDDATRTQRLATNRNRSELALSSETIIPGLRGVYHRARIRATRWLIGLRARYTQVALRGNSA